MRAVGVVLVSVSVPSSYRWPSVLHPLSHQGPNPLSKEECRGNCVTGSRVIGRGRICITGYDLPYACACFRRYEPLRDARQSLTERPSVNFFTSWSGTRRHFSGKFTRALQHKVWSKSINSPRQIFLERKKMSLTIISLLPRFLSIRFWYSNI